MKQINAQVKSNKKQVKTSANIKATFLFAGLVAAFIIVMGMINFTGIAYAANTTNLPASFTATETPKSFGFISGVKFSEDITATVDGQTYQLYCLEYGKNFPSTGNAYNQNTTNNSSYADNGIIYILNHAYPVDTTFMGNSFSGDEKKYVTQFAIWYYQCLRDNKTGVEGAVHTDYLEPSVIDKIKADTKYGTYIVNLAQQALAYQQNPPGDPTLTVDTSAITYSVTSDVKYLESSYIPVVPTSGTLLSYTVTIANNTYNAQIVDESGNVIANGSTLKPGAKFKIRVDIDKVQNTNEIDMQVDVKGLFEKQLVYSYTPTDSTKQTILYAAYETSTAPANLPLTFKMKTGPVKISKQDITNKTELAGATLTITDCKGQTVATWVSTTEPHYIDALPFYGDNCPYTLTETIAPEGYELSTETVTFNVTTDGNVTQAVMYDTPTTPVPPTSSSMPWAIYIIGGLAIIAGMAVVITSVKEQKQQG